MNSYYNLPAEQRFTHRLVNQFNADKRLWKNLAPRCRARRRILRRLPRKKLKTLGLTDFADERRSLEGVGRCTRP